jgi:hypothetical protein
MQASQYYADRRRLFVKLLDGAAADASSPSAAEAEVTVR